MITEKLVKIKATGKKVKVYRSSRRDTWINSNDLKTEYKPSELSFDS